MAAKAQCFIWLRLQPVCWGTDSKCEITSIWMWSELPARQQPDWDLDVNSSKGSSCRVPTAALSPFPELTEGWGMGGQRKATLSKSVEIQGINYAKWRNMGTWLLLWVTSILICGRQSATSPRHPHPSFISAAGKHQSSKKWEKQTPERPFPPEAPFKVTVLSRVISVLSVRVSTKVHFECLYFGSLDVWNTGKPSAQGNLKKKNGVNGQ